MFVTDYFRYSAVEKSKNWKNNLNIIKINTWRI
ncbi:hypothetical protein WRSd3_01626 [Shigella dysenteriae WRSd3]|uniref:Uncharacterized protein n=1 Tax=Shigella dysenteriae WRSd3 TaxID=1401327 RepID=A0A090NJ89_SHIDY|nr:hypothetical protein WRSd3_01626 [Shigella dysenteriae WRSd3]ESU83118.1 hypothetical protein WRSd5_02091 [Shigella dysenteriae WRSd5]